MLILIKNNGNIYNLSTVKYDFAQIARHLKNLKEENIIEYFDGELKLTQKGYNKLEKLENKLKYRGSESWISPQVYYHCDKMDIDEIYLPKNN